MERSFRRNKLLLAAILLFAVTAEGQTASKLEKEIQLMKSDPDLQHGSFGFCVMSTSKDSVLASYNEGLSLVPSSTMKILTTGAALSLLGSDFVFQTQLQYTGSFDTVSGVISGDLYIYGGGDPTLESEYFRDTKDSLTTVEKWAIILKAKGIKKIEGSIIGDASIFEDNPVPAQWIWADMGNYFGAGACGLTYHDNKYTLHLKSGKAGTKTSLLRIQPEIKNMQITNMVTAGGSSDNCFIYGSPYCDQRFAEGTIPPNRNDYEVEGSVPDPALFCAQALQTALENIDVHVGKSSTTVRALRESAIYTAEQRKNLYTYYSPTLDKIVYWTNLKSLNLYAEHLLKILAFKKNGTGTENAGTALVTEYWKSRGVDVAGFFMNDGCGLSRANVITTKTEVQVLRLMAKDQAFYNSLPVAGRTGSLAGLCEGTFAENNLRAKSGYITRARGYAGYVKTRQGNLICFSVLANNYECTAAEMKSKLEKLLIAISEM